VPYYGTSKKPNRRRPFVLPAAIAVLVVCGGGAVWWLWPAGTVQAVEPVVDDGLVEEQPSQVPRPVPSLPVDEKPPVAAARDEQVLIPADDDGNDAAAPRELAVVPPAGAAQSDGPSPERVSDNTRTGDAAIEQARGLYAAGKVIEARHRLNAMLGGKLGASEASEARTLLRRIADETIFSRRHVPNDPLTSEYVIQPGDRLIHIGKRCKVPYEVLMAINGISDAGRIRGGQRIKLLNGPFHVKIYKSKFRMDVYLGGLYVRSYRVGLGRDEGTPLGTWKVKERLENPTYYPPASAGEKRIVAPDDPTNPLGEHWIGLEGVSGAAVGREGYGVHGTIEPESIGQAVSLGCVRMHNEDVAQLYTLLLPGNSTVTTLP